MGEVAKNIESEPGGSRRQHGWLLYTIGASALLVAVPAGLFFLFLYALFGGLCGETEVMEVKSPDSRYVARAYIRDCGATTSFSPQVELSKNRLFLKDRTVVYIADGTDKIQVEWTSPSLLEIRCDPYKVRKIDSGYHDVGIKVEPLK